MRSPTLITAAVLAIGGPLAAQQAPVRLTLAGAVRRAAGAAPLVDLAGARADEAAARITQARAPLRPGLSLAAGWLNRTFNRQSFGIEFPTIPGQPAAPDLVGPFDNVDARLRVTQTLFDWSSRARVGAARSAFASATADAGFAAEAAAQTAALAYLRAARAEAALGARVADSALAGELLNLAQAQREAGVSAAIDVTRARAQFVTAEGQVVVARSLVGRAHIDLARALGLDPATPLVLTDSLSGDLAAVAVPETREDALALALERPDVGAERARGAAARQAAHAIAAERLPRLDLAADYGWNGRTAPDAIATRQIGVQVTVPILDGWRREGRLAEQQAVVRESAIRERDLHDEVAAELDAARLELEAARARSAIAAEQLRLGNDEVAQARERFAAGVAGNIEVINAQLALIRARDADIDARFAAAAARVALARAVGRTRDLR